jgi:hypothetical protein
MSEWMVRDLESGLWPEVRARREAPGNFHEPIFNPLARERSSWSLELGVSLELGAWSLELLIRVIDFEGL